MSDFLTFCYGKYYKMSEICIGRRFIEDSFYCYSQEIISVVGKESLTPYNLVPRAPVTQNL